MTLTPHDAIDALTTAHANARPDDEDRLPSLPLAGSALQKAYWAEVEPDHPTQVVVFGPTQSGKSTAVNLLLGHTAAGVSPLAGHTVHAQAFLQGHSDADALEPFFEGYTRTTPDALPGDALDYWSVAVVPGGDSVQAVWDTPDFDSLRAAEYLDSVARTIGLADVLLLMVSKDKYADHSVWQWLDLIAPLGKPVVVCVNKVDEASREVVIDALLARLAEHPISAQQPTVCLMPWFDAQDGPPDLEVTALRHAIDDAVTQLDRTALTHGARALIESNWADWTDPLSAELQARDACEVEIREAGDAILQSYRSEFLDHPEHYETFQHSLAEMLRLLELPGLASVLGYTRSIVTWPVRKVFGIASQTAGRARPESHEVQLLQDRHSEALSGLIEHALTEASLNGPNAAWWRAVATALRAQRGPWQAAFDQEVADYRRDFEPEIQRAAEQLYAGLQEQPAILNSLRAARFTADAAGVAFAVKTGGVGLADLALAPAMLSVTTLLTESALGKYIDTVMDALRAQQFDIVQSRLIDNRFRAALAAELDALSAPGLYRISQSELSAIGDALGQSA